jgi:hypothetical protein
MVIMRVCRYLRRRIREPGHLGCDAASLGVCRRFEGSCYPHVSGFKVHEENYDCYNLRLGLPCLGVESNSEHTNIGRCLVQLLEGDRHVAVCLPTPDIRTQRNVNILWSSERPETMLAGIGRF